MPVTDDVTAMAECDGQHIGPVTPEAIDRSKPAHDAHVGGVQHRAHPERAHSFAAAFNTSVKLSTPTTVRSFSTGTLRTPAMRMRRMQSAMA